MIGFWGPIISLGVWYEDFALGITQAAVKGAWMPLTMVLISMN
jgi:hypothetical protein